MAEVITETERLRLRTWDLEDRAEFNRLLNTPAVMRWLGGVSDEDFANAAFDRIDAYQQKFGFTFWIVERKEDGAMLGFCGLKRANAPELPAAQRFDFDLADFGLNRLDILLDVFPVFLLRVVRFALQPVQFLFERPDAVDDLFHDRHETHLFGN